MNVKIKLRSCFVVLADFLHGLVLTISHVCCKATLTCFFNLFCFVFIQSSYYHLVVIFSGIRATSEGLYLIDSLTTEVSLAIDDIRYDFIDKPTVT